MTKPQIARLVGVVWLLIVLTMGAILIVNGRLQTNRASMVILFFAMLPRVMIYRWGKLRWEEDLRPTRKRS